MKKLVLLFTAVVALGCSNDDDSNASGGTSFNYDGTQYQLQNGLSMNEIIMSDVADYNGHSYDRSTISVTGLNGTSSTATVAFDLYYKAGTSVAGTYNIYDSEATNAAADFEDFLVDQDRGCLGWTSASVVYSMGDETMTSANNPTGTVQVIVNSPTNYTLIYNGNFRVYDGFDFVSNKSAQINVTSDVTIQD